MTADEMRDDCKLAVLSGLQPDCDSSSCVVRAKYAVATEDGVDMRGYRREKVSS